MLETKIGAAIIGFVISAVVIGKLIPSKSRWLDEVIDCRLWVSALLALGVYLVL